MRGKLTLFRDRPIPYYTLVRSLALPTWKPPSCLEEYQHATSEPLEAQEEDCCAGPRRDMSYLKIRKRSLGGTFRARGG